MTPRSGLAIGFLLSGILTGCSCDPCPPKASFVATTLNGSTVVWTVDDKPATTSEVQGGERPYCEAKLTGTALVDEDAAGEAETMPYLLCGRESGEARGGSDQFELAYPYGLIPGYKGKASTRLNPIAWTEGQVLSMTAGEFGLELRYARDVANSGGAICLLAVEDLPITVTVEQATGGAADAPEGVTEDFVRLFRVELALDAARGEVEMSKPEIEGACPNTLTFSATLMMRLDASMMREERCILDGPADAGSAGAPDAGPFGGT